MHKIPRTRRRKIKLQQPLQFFGLGVAEDVLAALYTTCVAAHSPVLAAISASLITLLGIFVLSQIVLDASWKSNKLWSFALGNAVGTFVIVRFFAI